MPDNAVTREELRALLARAQMLAAQAESITSTSARSSREVAESYRAVVARMVARELGSIPVARLRDVTEGRLRLGPIESRYKTVAQLQNVSAYTLMQLPGVGEATASQVVAAVHTVARTVEDGFRLRIDLNASDPVTTDLLRLTWRYDSVTRAVAPVREPAGRMTSELDRLVAEAKPAGYGALRSFFTSRARKDAARAAVERIEQWTRWSDSPANAAAWAGAIAAIQAPTPSAAVAWRAFET
ncbi:MAG: hypothetical protein LCH60_02005, partial [Actinobacteria bacterium]|nr:hypothetical protein [Actinomycetota bacterium]